MRLNRKTKRLVHRIAVLKDEEMRLNIIGHEQGYENACLRARVAELEAALEHIGTCGREKMPHYCPNCSCTFSWEKQP